MVTERERLIEEARERWDDQWFLSTIEHADGDKHHRIHHSRENVADGIVIRDIMLISNGEVEVDRWLIDNQEYIAMVDEEGGNVEPF